MEVSSISSNAYSQVRHTTEGLTETLSAEDMVVQSMADASPVKWHLGHTTWFFETFILQKFASDYRRFNDTFPFIFNSYYESVGERHPRPRRGVLTRPSMQQVMDYRRYVDEQMMAVLDRASPELMSLVTVGLHHEMQHQELLLTDVLHLFSQNPLLPAVMEAPHREAQMAGASLKWTLNEGGVVSVGAEASGFSYDCEGPLHTVLLHPFRLANRLTTNGEWQEFMADGGYKNPLFWLSDGWDYCQRNSWFAPLYWQQKDGGWFQFGLDGLQPINQHAPVCHVSFYEADAFARWAGKRLPREHELEVCVQNEVVFGNLLEERCWRPQAATGANENLAQLYGDVWEWTQSAYSPYPKFSPEQGALGEYNGKFMANQFVLKGGSCITPKAQMRSSYRNFFYPHQRWQFMGLRLAEDI